MRLFPTFALIAGLLVFSEITLGHGTASHDEEDQIVEQTPVVRESWALSHTRNYREH
jgi:hypothetical protein